jgi:hypothetical protein
MPITHEDLVWMVEALCEIEEGLTDWEVEFVENTSHRIPRYAYGDKQAEKVAELYEKHC